MALPKPPNLHAQFSPAGVDAPVVDPAKDAADLQAVRQELAGPMDEAKSLRWTKDFRFIGILVLGLFPVLAQAIFSQSPPTIFWCFGLYFSALWALFFYYFFSPAGASRVDTIGAFAATAIISVVVLFGLSMLGLGKLTDPYTSSTSALVQLGANLLAVALPAELCKALVLVYYLKRGPGVPTLPAMVFYGLMSGLGFGIYEGMQYQATQSFGNVNDPAAANAGAAALYFDSMLRLVTLPFLNAMWTAIAAYFLTLGWLYSSRRYVLWAVALGVPVLLHGLHATWADTLPWVGLVLDLVSVFAVMIYLLRGPAVEKVPANVAVPSLPVTPA